MAKGSSTAEVPRYKHFTVDPEHPIGADVEDEKNTSTLDAVPPAAAFNEAEGEQLKGLSEKAADEKAERDKAEAKEAEERAKSDERPKPSELLASQQGAGTTDEPSGSSSTSKS